ncbi:MAG: diadenylate cyclase CdaA [Candidatus Saccharibacteria bacterium]
MQALGALWSDPVRLVINLIDISIVSFVFYRLLLLIRGTRAEQLIKGLVFLLAFSAVSRWAGLSAVNWLLDKAWTGIFIALPVVFQPELRRALEQIGRGRLFPGSLGHEKTSVLTKNINELVAAVTDLSKRRIGALIVLTRRTGLKDFLDIGVDLDSAISQELLINIFTPNTPLHDGAVIITNHRIEKAGAFLPLSDNPNLGKNLGTRHRAAVGISEVSDALAIVVSEENGSIGLASEGKIVRFLDESSLRQILQDELVAPYTRKQKLWRRPTHDR